MVGRRCFRPHPDRPTQIGLGSRLLVCHPVRTHRHARSGLLRRLPPCPRRSPPPSNPERRDPAPIPRSPRRHRIRWYRHSRHRRRRTLVGRRRSPGFPREHPPSRHSPRVEQLHAAHSRRVAARTTAHRHRLDRFDRRRQVDRRRHPPRHGLRDRRRRRRRQSRPRSPRGSRLDRGLVGAGRPEHRRPRRPRRRCFPRLFFARGASQTRTTGPSHRPAQACGPRPGRRREGGPLRRRRRPFAL